MSDGLINPPQHEREQRWLRAVLTFAILLHLFALGTYRFDSDEPQHLHVAWGWTQGLVQYRDFFDNHAPLLHIVTAPLLGAVGERSDVITIMRLAMVPFYLAALLTTWLIARKIYSDRIALWSVVVLALLFPFFFKTIEFRNDNPWVAVWLVIVLLSISSARSGWKLLLSGLLLGVALTLSMKTTLLIGSLLLASLLLILLGRAVFWRSPRPLLTLMAGTAVVPGLTALYFVRHNAWRELIYCVFEFNSSYPVPPGRRIAGALAFPLLLALIFFVARSVARKSETPSSRLFVALILSVYVAAVLCFWTIITARDFAPAYPLMAIFLVSAIVSWAARRQSWWAPRGNPRLALATLVVIELLTVVFAGEVWRDETGERTRPIEAALRYTRRGEKIMDLKGETIFRERPFYYVLEHITKTQLARGTISDSIIASVQRSGCAVIGSEITAYPRRDQLFFANNFLEAGGVRIAGRKVLTRGGSSVRFEVGVPAEYAVLAEHGSVAVMIDGVRYSVPRWLPAGWHSLSSQKPVADRYAVVWAPAVRRGYNPFEVVTR